MGRVAGLVLGGWVLGAAPVWAQPIIIPLEPQKPRPEATPAPQPMVSAPPVAPPQAGPSLPSTTDMATGAPQVNPSEETASQPPPR